MKSIYILSALCFVLLFSCEDELDQNPLSNATPETFFTNNSDFVQGVNAVYERLRTYPERQLNLSETRSDNIYGASDGGVRDWEGINGFHKTISSNPYITEAWLTNLNGIHKANVVLEQLERRGNIITNPALRTRLEAEAKFLRGFFYFDLVRLFGAVPLTEKPVTPAEALSVARSQPADVYQLIMSDLKFAVQNLPISYSAADKGRATSNAAKGILALVHMTRSGPSYGVEGPGLGLNEWSEALTLLNEIIASNQHSFLPTYSDIFSYTNENNGEVIFDVQFLSGGLGLGSTFAIMLTPEGFFNSQGLPNQGGSDRPISNDLMNSFEPDDLRKAFSIKEGYVNAGVANNIPFYVKWVDVTKYGTSRTDWPINFIVLRYTDVLMMKAECILRGAPGTQSEVDEIVNKVRARAGLVTTVSDVTLPQLMEERRKEFVSEGLRWHDLVRSGLVETKIPEWIASEDVKNQMLDFQIDYIIYPIPQAEIDVRPGLYQQNKGY